MKKEIIFAVLIGLIVGLIIMFGVYQAQKAMQSASTTNTDVTDTLSSPPPDTSATASQDAFTVSEPLDESIATDANIHVTGQTIPNAAIIIINTTPTETVGMSDANGNFSIPYVLQPGSNVLRIRVMSNTQDTMEVVRSVIFSTADLTVKNTPAPTPTSSSTPKAKATAKPTSTPKATP
ncbi:hypothetical protein C5B42_01705 [Candidatus Cerribacteria bacterium 'Amazon FNV 2010 28 9']|uniref:Uncharacterized protein n=1 Tax=Candidatus Cerribacteria bacterium 'Amazon FNV 2010 28 9' TaxID=2081795 RepID=A0A317JPG5_9BACT|nr:MAG: hypothetical protein C5B42_01705 [Candidatus Cerribacteria bacterium 'Amazon FNV 2010 28 9']